MKEKIVENKYGKFSIDIPEEVVVDEKIGWHIRFELSVPIAKGGGLQVLFPAYAHQRSVEYVQVIDYWKPHFIYAYFEDEDAAVSVKVEKIASEFTHILRWKDSDRIAVITAQEDWPAGAVLHICYGGTDRMWLKGYASPTRAPHHAAFAGGNKLKYQWKIDSKGTGEYQSMDLSMEIGILPDKPKYLEITAPTIVKPKQEFIFRYTIRDQFRNPIWKLEEVPEFILRNLSGGEEIKIKGNRMVMEEVGMYEIDARHSELVVEKAVICCKETDQAIYWGDTHCHTVLTPNIRDNNNGALPQDAYDYARYVSALDFVCLVEQTFLFDENANQNITKKLWKEIQTVSNQNNISGEFVTFPGFELHSRRGDTVVLFADNMADFPYPEGATDIYDIWRLYQGKRYLTIPHFHRYCGGRLSKDQQEQQHSGFDLKNWLQSDPAEVLCEFYSAQWGRFEYPNNPMLLKAMSNIPENDVVSFLNRGKMWGMTAGSDDHDSMPGHGGLTAVYAGDLTRAEIYNGLQARHTYATTHTRIYLDFSLENAQMGERVERSSISGNDLRFRAEMAAPVAIRSVDWIVNGRVYRKESIGQCTAQVEETIAKSDLEPDSYVYLRIKLENEDIVVSSPIRI